MCHDISFSATTIELVTDYLPNLLHADQLQLDWETAIHHIAQAHKPQPVIINENGLMKLKTFEWGLIAPYMNTPEKIKQYRNSMVNARSEKLFDTKSIWHTIRQQRCLVPLSGIFEHRKVEGWKNKVPYHIQLKGQSFFFLPGLYCYNPVPNPETGELVGTFTLLTRSANALMQQIHNDGPNQHRMPIFISNEEALNWLSPNLTDIEIGQLIEREIPSDQLEAWPVFSIRTTQPRPDGKSKTEPFDWPNLPTLTESDRPAAQGSLFVF